MKIENTKLIAEEVNYDIANQYIEMGWTLINHYVIDVSENNIVNQKIRSVLAWQHPDIETTHPKTSFHQNQLKLVEKSVDDIQKEGVRF